MAEDSCGIPEYSGDNSECCHFEGQEVVRCTCRRLVSRHW